MSSPLFSCKNKKLKFSCPNDTMKKNPNPYSDQECCKCNFLGKFHTVIWTNHLEWRKYSGKAEQAFFWVLHSLKIPILFLKISYIQRRFSAEAMPKFKKIYKCTMLLISRCIFVSQTSLKSKEYKIISLFIQNYITDTT